MLVGVSSQILVIANLNLSPNEVLKIIYQLHYWTAWLESSQAYQELAKLFQEFAVFLFRRNREVKVWNITVPTGNVWSPVLDGTV